MWSPPGLPNSIAGPWPSPSPQFSGLDAQSLRTEGLRNFQGLGPRSQILVQGLGFELLAGFIKGLRAWRISG